MNLDQLIELTQAKLLNPEVGTDEVRNIESGYSCDLLSWVMTHGHAGMAWVTVQTHLNVVAVATLLDLSCVIIPENIEVPEATLAKATEEGVPILSCAMTAYEVCGRLYAGGVQPPKG